MGTDIPLGLRTLYDPISYWRTAEFSYVIRRFRQEPLSSSILFDLASPKLLACLLSLRLGREVVTADLWRKEVYLAKQYAAGLNARVVTSQQDGRYLAHPTNCFGAAFSVSVLEHIPDHGDREAVAELARIVRPGGIIVGTVPFARSQRDTYVEKDVYSRVSSGKPIFFQRHYDSESVKDRLVEGLSVDLENLEIWKERKQIEAHIYHTRFVKYLSPPVQPLLARLFLEEGKPTNDEHASAFFTLRVR